MRDSKRRGTETVADFEGVVAYACVPTVTEGVLVSSNGAPGGSATSSPPIDWEWTYCLAACRSLRQSHSGGTGSNGPARAVAAAGAAQTVPLSELEAVVCSWAQRAASGSSHDGLGGASLHVRCCPIDRWLLPPAEAANDATLNDASRGSACPTAEWRIAVERQPGGGATDACLVFSPLPETVEAPDENNRALRFRLPLGGARDGGRPSTSESLQPPPPAVWMLPDSVELRVTRREGVAAADVTLVAEERQPLLCTARKIGIEVSGWLLARCLEEWLSPLAQTNVSVRGVVKKLTGVPPMEMFSVGVAGPHAAALTRSTLTQFASAWRHAEGRATRVISKASASGAAADSPQLRALTADVVKFLWWQKRVASHPTALSQSPSPTEPLRAALGGLADAAGGGGSAACTFITAVVFPPAAQQGYAAQHGGSGVFPSLVVGFPNPKGFFVTEYDAEALEVVARALVHLDMVCVTVYDETQRLLLQDKMRKHLAAGGGGSGAADGPTVARLLGDRCVAVESLLLPLVDKSQAAQEASSDATRARASEDEDECLRWVLPHPQRIVRKSAIPTILCRFVGPPPPSSASPHHRVAALHGCPPTFLNYVYACVEAGTVEALEGVTRTFAESARSLVESAQATLRESLTQ